MTTEQVLLRLTRAHAYRDAGYVNQEMDRILDRDRDQRLVRLALRIDAAKKDAAKSATPQS